MKLDLEHLVTKENNEESKVNLDLKSIAADLDHLVKEMKNKLQTANRRQKLQILTLTPKSWSLRHAAKEFNVSRGTMRKAMILKE